MAYNDGGLVFSQFNVTGTIAQYKIVQVATTAGTVKVSTSATSKSIGVMVNDATAGQAALVQYGGIALVLSENSVTEGSMVGSSSTGRAKIVSSGNDKCIGTALEDGSAGYLIRVMLNPHNL